MQTRKSIPQSLSSKKSGVKTLDFFIKLRYNKIIKYERYDIMKEYKVGDVFGYHIRLIEK